MIKWVLLGVLTILVLGVILILYFYPPFGGIIPKKAYASSKQRVDGKFINAIETKMDMGFAQILQVSKEFLKKDASRSPHIDIEIDKLDLNTWDTNKDYFVWFGHSAFLLQLDGKRIFLDPMLGNTPSPFEFLGTKRYQKELPLAVEEIPHLDLIVISHDHYDHLDYGTITVLKDKTKQFFVPLGIKFHLLKWGVEEDKIVEFDWLDNHWQDSIQFHFLTARHFSGRGIGDRFSTLWGSWVIKSTRHNIYFSGDSGYGPHFKEIGETFGPFDLSLIECGQYNLNWHDIHMLPEEAVKAAADINTNLAMPIHWGSFTLALHPWQEPVREFITHAKVPTLVPAIGETILLDTLHAKIDEWWN